MDVFVCAFDLTLPICDVSAWPNLCAAGSHETQALQPVIGMHTATKYSHKRIGEEPGLFRDMTKQNTKTRPSGSTSRHLLRGYSCNARLALNCYLLGLPPISTIVKSDRRSAHATVSPTFRCGSRLEHTCRVHIRA